MKIPGIRRACYSNVDSFRKDGQNVVLPACITYIKQSTSSEEVKSLEHMSVVLGATHFWWTGLLASEIIQHVAYMRGQDVLSAHSRL